jgi:uncharacterized protein (DUF433 family)
MSKVVSMRIADEQAERLQRVARRLGRTASETSALFVEEGLRQAEFGQIEFRNSAVGRQAYVRGTSLAVWGVVSVAREFGLDAEQTATHLQWPLYRVQAALNYATAFPNEIADAIEDNDSYTFEKLRQLLPNAELYVAGGTE